MAGGDVTLSPHDVENNVAVGEVVVTGTVTGTGMVVVDVLPETDKTSQKTFVVIVIAVNTHRQ